MSDWLLIAIIGHLLNAASFIVDKSLLTTTFKRSATCAAIMGLVSSLVVLASPWVKYWPSFSLLPAVAGCGIFFVCALWAFFEALRRAETSRVVPIVGSLVPLFTLLGTATLVHERLTIVQLLGFLFLVSATVLLTQGGTKRTKVSLSVVGLSTLAAFLFAAASVTGKYAFDHADFLGVLILSRLIGGGVALFIGFVLSPAARKEILGLRRSNKKTGLSLSATIWSMIGQLMGGVGFIFLYLALVRGSAAIVNALQAVQYAALVLVAWFGGKKLRKILHEERTPTIIFLKSLAIVMVGVGLALIVGI